MNLNVEVHWEKISDGDPDAEPEENTSLIRDISVGGIRLIVNEAVRVGDVLEVRLRVSEGKNIPARGRVVWVDTYEIIGGKDQVGYECGIEFIGISDEVKNEIGKFIFDLSHKKPSH